MAAKKKQQTAQQISEEEAGASVSADPDEAMSGFDEGGAPGPEDMASDAAADSSGGFPDASGKEGDTVQSAINLDANLSIQNVVKLHEKLKKAYAAFDAIEIDASQVASIDTATLQLFAALKKDAAKHNKSVEFFQPSARFVESARLLDLVDALEIIDL